MYGRSKLSMVEWRRPAHTNVGGDRRCDMTSAKEFQTVLLHNIQAATVQPAGATTGYQASYVSLYSHKLQVEQDQESTLSLSLLL